MKPDTTRIAPAVFLAALLMAAPVAVPAVAQTAPPASAQSGAQQSGAQQSGAQQSGSEQFSDAQLKSFAEASLEVERLSQEWSPKIAAAWTAQEQAKARGEAMEQMAEAVEQKGLSVQEYNEIVNAAQTDTETARTVETYRTELR